MVYALYELGINQEIAKMTEARSPTATDHSKIEGLILSY